MSRLLIRADANSAIGSGHVMRCLALAQAWRDSGGEVVFASAESVPTLVERLQGERMRFLALEVERGSSADTIATIDAARQEGCAAVVADGYQFGSEFQQRIVEAGLRLLFVDDNGHGSLYVAHWVLNQNIHAEAAMYDARAARTRLLLGPRFALLRREFVRGRASPRGVPDAARRILVTLGGSDPDNATLKVIRVLQKFIDENRPLPKLEALVVVGAGNPHYEQLESEIHYDGIRLIRNPPNMPELMAWADVAVSAGGSTCLELAFFGLPSVLLVIADNQAGSAARLHQAGVAFNVGRTADCSVETLAHAIGDLLQDAERRKEMSRWGRELVDGLGAARVVAAIRGEIEQ